MSPSSSIYDEKPQALKSGIFKVEGGEVNYDEWIFKYDEWLWFGGISWNNNLVGFNIFPGYGRYPLLEASKQKVEEVI